MTIRWVFYDPTAVETWTVPLNPNTMSSPYPIHGQDVSSVSPVDGAVRVVESSQPVEWTFGGVMRTQDHYDTMLAWVGKPNQIRITDHLARVITVVLTRFAPTDVRARNIATKWSYVVTGFVLDVTGGAS